MNIYFLGNRRNRPSPNIPNESRAEEPSVNPPIEAEPAASGARRGRRPLGVSRSARRGQQVQTVYNPEEPTDDADSFQAAIHSNASLREFFEEQVGHKIFLFFQKFWS